MGQLKEELLLNTKQFDANINNVIKKVDELKTKGSKIGEGFDSSFGKMIDRASGFNTSLKGLTSLIGKLGGAFGAITAGASLADWLSSSVQEGLKLAEQGEGIRIAFERLNRGDLLAKLREETHNTVTDIELMKQAVKFNDFKLNLDQMGTLLAFAQQKAKDTGESIDYMVNSIVTGLGRKSLPILDNLGLSAAEIKEEMKKGGDMTTAVAKIIERQMQSAGDYVETAADRAKKKEVELQNALEQLGQTFSPLQETSSNFWHSIEIGAINAINKIAPLINQFTTLGRILNNYNNIGGGGKVNSMVAMLGDGKGNAKNVYNKQLQEFDRYSEKLKFKIAALNGDKSSVAKSVKQNLDEQLSAVKKMRAEYVREADKIFNPKSSTTSSNNVTPTSTNKGGKTEIQYALNSVGYLENKISELQKKIKLQVDASEIGKLQEEIKQTQIQLDNLLNPRRKIDIKTSGLGSLFKDPSNKELNKEATNLQLDTKTIFEQYQELTDGLDKVLEAYDMGAIGSKKAKELIDSINNQIEGLGLKPIQVHIESDFEKSINKIDKASSAIGKGFSSLDNVVSNITNFTNAINDGANAWETFMGTLQIGISIIQAVSSVIETLNTLQELFGEISVATAEKNAAAGATEMSTAAGVTAAKSGEAIAGATASGAKLAFPYNLIAIAAGVAAVLAALATISGSFANGGVIGGNSYSGDRLLARVNSGEAILNQNQQKHLFTLLDGNHQVSNSASNVHFVIRGRDLIGVIDNYNDKIRKVR